MNVLRILPRTAERSLCDEFDDTFVGRRPWIVLQRSSQASKGIAAKLDNKLRGCHTIVLAVCGGCCGEKDYTAWPRGPRCLYSIRFSEQPGRTPRQYGPISKPAISRDPYIIRIRGPTLPGSAGAGSESGRHSKEARAASRHGFPGAR